MNLEEYISLLENPDSVAPQHVRDLQEMLRYAPYCANTRLLLLKGLHSANDVNFEAELPATLLYAPSSRALHSLLFPDDKKRLRRPRHTGDYFDMLETMEKTRRQTNESLQELAERLRRARLQLQQPASPQPTGMPPEGNRKPLEISEEAAKKCIKTKKYAEAIEILEQLSLNNPKKKSIFADQIRFLKKII